MRSRTASSAPSRHLRPHLLQPLRQAIASSAPELSYVREAQGSVVSFFSDMGPALATIVSSLGTATTAISALNGLAGLPTSQVTGIVTALNSANTATQSAIQIGDGNVFTGTSEIGGVKKLMRIA